MALKIAKELFDIIYPIGSYYETSNANWSPSSAGWYGTWVEDTKGKTTVGKADSGTFATLGGSVGAETKSYTPAGTIGGTAITVDQMPSHNHVIYGWPNKGNLNGDGIYAVQDQTYGTGGPNTKFLQQIKTQNKGGGKNKMPRF